MMKGYETFVSTIQSQIKNPNDIIVSAIHWIFVQEFELKCIGIGEKIDQESNGSELLPTGWNSKSDAYELLYRSLQKSETFLLKCIVVDDSLIVNLSPFNSSSSQDINSVIILKSEFIPTNNDDLNSLIKNFAKDKIDLLNELIQEKFEKFNPNINQQKKKTISNKKEIPMPPPFSTLIDTQAKSRTVIDGNDPLFPRIGGADLDPFGQGLGGGMIFDPFSNNPRIRPQGGPRPGGKFSGPVPPFARYDPIGPLPDSRFFRPDPDHFQPPRGPGFDPNFL